MNRALPVATGLIIDRFAGDPDTDIHPVAAFGKLMTEIENRLWADSRQRGVLHTGIGVAFGVATGLVVSSTAAVTSVAVAGNGLRRSASEVADLLDTGDLEGAQEALRSLVGRDTADLDASQISAAAVESVAENMVDAVFAPVCWALLAGAPGVATYRAVNTMDAMVGNRSERHALYGWASARLDDLASWVPARVFAVAVIAARPDRRRAIARAIRRDAPLHPSPNSGIAEAAVAGALGLQLGGPLSYDGQIESRPTLGEGRRPHSVDIRAAVRLVNRIELGLTGVLVVAGVAPILVNRVRRRWWS